MIQQQASELVVLATVGAVRLRDDATEQSRMSAKAVGVNRGLHVDVVLLDHPTRNVDFVEIDAEMQERPALQRRAM